MADLPARRRVPPILFALAVVGAAKVGLWLYFRSRQPFTDQCTRDRLQPKGARA